MTDADEINDGRGRYPVVLKARTSVAMRDDVKRAAAAEHLTTGAFIRDALSKQVSSVLRSTSLDQQQVDGINLEGRA